MIELDRGTVVLLKMARRVRLMLGNSVALWATDVVQMRDGSFWSVAHRRSDYFNHRPNIPLTVACQLNADSFEVAVQWVRDMERQYITRELSEWSA